MAKSSLAALLIPGKIKEEKPEEEEMPSKEELEEHKHEAAEEILEAIKKNDASLLVDALDTWHGVAHAVMEMPEEEEPDSSEDESKSDKDMEEEESDEDSE